MPVNLYECLVLLDPNKAAGDPEGTRAGVHSILEKHGSEIVVSRPWDRDRKLAYPVGKHPQHKKGQYHLIYFKTDSKNLTGIDYDFRISETVLRHLTLAVHPKWADKMLELARDEHNPAPALQSAPEESLDGSGPPPPPRARGEEGGGDEEGGGPPHRRRREMAEEKV